MPQETQRIKAIILGHLKGELSDDDQSTLTEWLAEDERNRWLFDQVSNEQVMPGYLAKMDSYHEDAAWDRLEKELENGMTITEHPVPVHRIHLLRTAWFRYVAAAVIILFIGSVAYLWKPQDKRRGQKADGTEKQLVANDVLPGSNRATLTLADGSTIHLDSAVNGKIADQGETTIEKKGEQIVYTSPISPLPSPVSYNTMRTPRGGQYQLTLPDGSRVWLNAASSITYPTAFIGKERRVSVTGEAYFEVAKDKTKPFKVSIPSTGNPIPSMGGEEPRSGSGVGIADNGSFEIEVLGTHFNVNAYTDEETSRTTLLEGSIKITNPKSSRTLSPGQAATIHDSRLTIHEKTNTELAVAWKNGLFNFQDKHLKEVMRQLERWYDLQVVYENNIPDIEFFGKMGRNLKLSDVLEVLKSSGVHFRLESNRKLVVMP